MPPTFLDCSHSLPYTGLLTPTRDYSHFRSEHKILVLNSIQPLLKFELVVPLNREQQALFSTGTFENG